MIQNINQTLCMFQISIICHVLQHLSNPAVKFSFIFFFFPPSFTDAEQQNVWKAKIINVLTISIMRCPQPDLYEFRVECEVNNTEFLNRNTHWIETVPRYGEVCDIPLVEV